MLLQTKYPVSIACAYLWIGFIVAFSFIETPLKFKATGVTQSIGLSIGRLIFKALNKIEWALVIIIGIELIIVRENFSLLHLIYTTLILSLLIQSFYLLPVLQRRADLRIKGLDVSASFHHFFYILFEFLKVTFLLIFSIYLFNNV